MKSWGKAFALVMLVAGSGLAVAPKAAACGETMVRPAVIEAPMSSVSVGACNTICQPAVVEAAPACTAGGLTTDTGCGLFRPQCYLLRQNIAIEGCPVTRRSPGFIGALLNLGRWL